MRHFNYLLVIAMVLVAMLTACGKSYLAIDFNDPREVRRMEFVDEEWVIFYNWDVSGDEDRYSGWHPAHEDNEELYNSIPLAASVAGFPSERMEKFVKEDLKRERFILIVFSREELERNAVTFVVKHEKGADVLLFEFEKNERDSWFDFYRESFVKIRRVIPKREPADPGGGTGEGTSGSAGAQGGAETGGSAGASGTTSGSTDSGVGTGTPAPAPPPEPPKPELQGILKPNLVGDGGVLFGVGSSKIHEVLNKDTLATATIELGGEDRGQQKFPDGTTTVQTKATNKTFVIDKAFGESGDEIAMPAKLKGKRMWLFNGDAIVETVPKVTPPV